MSISIYLILLIILLLFNLVFWILIVWFRILFDCGFGKCCSSESQDDHHPPPRGHQNLAFEDTENLFSGRPYIISERMESPPSYEEALKYEQFGFHESSSVHTPSPSTSPPSSSSPRSDLLSRERRLPQLPSSPSRISEARSRSSTVGSNSILTPIQEEELEESPVTVVIDCIGVQASRLIENCDTKIDISGTEELNGQSKC